MLLLPLYFINIRASSSAACGVAIKIRISSCSNRAVITELINESYISFIKIYGPVAQLVRAPAS